MNVQFSQKMAGTERKLLLAPIAKKADQAIRYTGAPSFAYEAAGWTVDKNGVVSSPVFSVDDALEETARVPALLGEAGSIPEGVLTVTLHPGHADDEKAGMMQSLLRGKETLIRAALGTDKALSVVVDGNVYALPFFSATLDPAYIMAAVQFSHCIYEQALQQKRVTAKDKPVENERYTFRCFLLRIGMIGKEYSLSRKTLMAPLSGNSAFKSGPPPQKPDLPGSHEEAQCSEV